MYVCMYKGWDVERGWRVIEGDRVECAYANKGVTLLDDGRERLNHTFTNYGLWPIGDALQAVSRRQGRVVFFFCVKYPPTNQPPY